MVRIMKLEKIFGLGFSGENVHLRVPINGDSETLTPDRFKWILPTGTLEGYH
jgi:hypothetical protein